MTLNPKAPEFSPMVTQKPILYSYFLPPTSPIFNYINQFPHQHFKSYHHLPKKKPNKAKFCNQKNLPPRHLKNKVHNFSKDKLAGKTTLMIRNIPNSFGRSDLLRILDSHCWKNNRKASLVCDRSSYDFIYLPMDFLKHANLGYAFVNFTSSIAAEKFRREFDNHVWDYVGSKKKVCEITIAKFQGKEELSQHFKHSKFTCHTDQYLPVVLLPPSDGFTTYKIMTLGDRVGLRGGVSRRTSSL